MSSGLASRGMKAGAEDDGSALVSGGAPPWVSTVVEAIVSLGCMTFLLFCFCELMRQSLRVWITGKMNKAWSEDGRTPAV